MLFPPARGEVFPCLSAVCELTADGVFRLPHELPVPLAAAHLLLRRRLFPSSARRKPQKAPVLCTGAVIFYMLSRISCA